MENQQSSLELEVKVLRGHRKYEQKQYDRVKALVEKAQANLKALQNDNKELGRIKAIHNEDIKRLQKQIKSLVDKSAKAKDVAAFELRQVKDEITNRKKYLDEQEKLIESTMEAGNDELKGLRYQIGALAKDKQEVENETFNSQQILERLSKDVSNEAINLQAFKLGVQEEKDKLARELAPVKKAIVEARVKLSNTTNETTAKLNILKQKEEELMSREEAIRNKVEDLNIRERRLNSSERLYNML